MPTYNVYVRANTLSDEKKKKAAQAITKSHSHSTGAPEFYVQVIFNEVLDSNRFVSGHLCNRHMWIRGDVRIGRNAEQRKRWMLEMIKDVSESIDWDINAIWIDLCGIEPDSILKYGQVFPPAGQEQEWLENLPDGAKEIIRALIDGKG
ncbi:MAG: tautomerase family protein [Deltaproteobacteria bacterium]|nr:tautomerase family protein [Deltaproteobacteria bacterium]